jgi:hypothetical protein
MAYIIHAMLCQILKPALLSFITPFPLMARKNQSLTPLGDEWGYLFKNRNMTTFSLCKCIQVFCMFGLIPFWLAAGRF